MHNLFRYQQLWFLSSLQNDPVYIPSLIYLGQYHVYFKSKINMYVCTFVNNIYRAKQTWMSGNALGFWICGCRCILESSGSQNSGCTNAHSTRSLKIGGCKRWCPKDQRVRAPAAPVLTHSLNVNSRLSVHISVTCFSKTPVLYTVGQ